MNQVNFNCISTFRFARFIIVLKSWISTEFLRNWLDPKEPALSISSLAKRTRQGMKELIRIQVIE